MEELREEIISFPRVGEMAPLLKLLLPWNFKAGRFQRELAGVIFSSCRLTPVCTTEFIAFSQAYPEFQKRSRAPGTQRG